MPMRPSDVDEAAGRLRPPSLLTRLHLTGRSKAEERPRGKVKRTSRALCEPRVQWATRVERRVNVPSLGEIELI